MTFGEWHRFVRQTGFSHREWPMIRWHEELAARPKWAKTIVSFDKRLIFQSAVCPSCCHDSNQFPKIAETKRRFHSTNVINQLFDEIQNGIWMLPIFLAHFPSIRAGSVKNHRGHGQCWKISWVSLVFRAISNRYVSIRRLPLITFLSNVFSCQLHKK